MMFLLVLETDNPDNDGTVIGDIIRYNIVATNMGNIVHPASAALVAGTLGLKVDYAQVPLCTSMTVALMRPL